MTSVDKRSSRTVRSSAMLPTVPSDKLGQAVYAASIAEESAAESAALGYTSRVFTQTCLPYRDPLAINPALPAWTRRNGTMTLTVEPATVMDETTGELVRKMPFGKYPRLLLPWITTQIVRNQSDRERDGSMTIEFAASLPKLFDTLGQSWGGKSGALLIEQLPRLLGARISVFERDANKTGQGLRTSGYQVADGYELWWGTDKHLQDNGGLWGNTIILSSRFVEDVLASPIPIDLRAVAVMSKSGPMAMDMLAWLNYRLPSAKRPSLVTWDQLHAQFGAQYNHVRFFKREFIKKLPAVHAVYREARFEVEATGLRIFPSPPAVERKQIKG